MHFQTLNLQQLHTQATDCLIIGVFEDKSLSSAAQAIDRQSQGYLSQLLNQGDITGELGQTLLLHHVPQIAAKRILLVGCGKPEKLDGHVYRKMLSKMVAALAVTPAIEAICCLTEIPLLDNRDSQWKIQHLVQLTLEGLYRFEQLKSQKPNKNPAISKLFIPIIDTETVAATTAMAIGEALASGTELTRTLGNLPPNICTPTYLAEQALLLAQSYPSIKTTILEKSAMQTLGMGAILAVAQGSEQPPKFIIMEYQGKASATKPIVLVGKGITFDTGGISLKPPLGMIDMKYDMCGGATIFGVLKAVAQLKLPLNIVGLIPATENMPSGSAVKPSDIVTSMSGQTIEILNTDAEGRLVLCDALTYSERYQADVVIDIATLTGAMIVALGFHTTGLMSNNDKLADDLLAASMEADDRAWRLPLWDDYQEALQSNFADFPNVSDQPVAGSITAACFLARFTKNLTWAHLDIAGTAWKGGKEKGATGRPVGMLLQYLLNRCS